MVFGEANLGRRILKTDSSYDEVRTHPSLNKETLHSGERQRTGNVVALPALRGLHHYHAQI